ncbi:MAG: 6-bladed beta-propeller [Bacteroidaceae bacterium]|nr:6-bladed beta-propeller [Bacteroidaceae bacterium]
MKKLNSLFLVIALLCSCKENRFTYSDPMANMPIIAQQVISPQGDTIVVCNTSLIKDTVDFPISNLLSEFELVKLEDTDEALIDGVYRFAVTPMHLCLFSYNDGLKLFDKEGHFITNISNRGQGPFEYFNAVDDLFIDEDERVIYFSGSFQRNLLVFDLKGNALKQIPFAQNKPVNPIRFKIDKENDKLYIYQETFKDKEALCFWTQDYMGNMKQQIKAGHLAPNSTHYNLGDLMNTNTLDYSAGYWWDDDRVDSLYHYDEGANRMKPVFTANLTSIPTFHLYVELPNHYLIKMGNYGGVLTNYKYILIDKQTLKGSYVHFKLDMLGNIDLQEWIYFVHGNYFKEIHPYELLEKWQGSNDFSELPANMAKFMKYLQTHDIEDMNNVVLIGKLKQNKDEEFVLHDMNY